MAYITARELRAVVPDQYRDAALSDQGGEPDPGLLSAVIDQACEEVDALIEGRVRLPLSTPFPQKIRTAAVYFALEILFTRRALEMPDATAKKIAGIRSDLGKVGAGDLRLEAPVEQTAASRQAGGSIVVRPSITGAGGMIGAIVLLLAGLAHPAKAIDPRTFSFLAPTNPMIESPDHMEWSQAESVELRYTLPAADNSREIRWEISDRTNLWLNLSPVRSGAVWSWSPSPTQTCLPPGRYDGRVAAYGRSGTNLTFHRVIAWQSIRVHSARDPQTLVMASPLLQTPEQDPVAMAAIASVTQQLADVVAPLATTGYVVAAVAPLATTQQLADAVAPLATTGALAEAVAPLASTGYVAAAVAPLASTQQLADAVAPLASTQQLADAVAPLATTGALAAAVAPLASTQQLADAVAPLATTGYVAAAVAPLASTQQLADAVAPLATTGALAEAVAPLASTGYVAAAVAPLASTQQLADAVAPLASTQQLANAVAPLATTGALAAAVAPLASTQQLADAVAPLATTGYVAAAVAPLASTQQLADAVAPLATTGYVAAAVAPLASTQQLADAVAPANIYGMLADVGVEIVEDADDYYIASVSDYRTGASISFDAMHIYARPEMPWNFVGGPPPTISGVPIATTQALADAVAPLATTQALADAVAPLATNAATWWTYPAGGDADIGGHSITNVSEVLVQYADGGSKLFIEPGGIRSSIGLNLVMDESRIERLYFVDTPNNQGLLIDDAYAITDSTIYSLPPTTGTPFAVSADHAYAAHISYAYDRRLTKLSVATTNAPQKSNAQLRFLLDGAEIGTLMPRCDGTTQELWFAATTGAFVEVESFGVPSPAGDDADPIITDLRFSYMGNPNLVNREMETANQIITADYPQSARQVATKIYADDASAAALDLALDEVWRRTQDTDLQGNTMRFNPRYDIYGTNDLLNFKFGGETMLQFDGTGSKVIPEIRSFSVGPGTTAEMTVWSYAGGETNLVPEVSTNLQDWLRLDASAIVSAAMLDQYTAKIVFTNSAPKAQFVRLVDVSGGEGDPVVRVLAAMELGGVKSTTWPGLPALEVVDVGDIPGEGYVEWTWTVNAAAPARTIVFSDPSVTDKHPILIWPPPYTPAAVQEVKVISPPNGMSLAYAEEFDNAATGETAYYAYTFYPAHNAWYLSGWSSGISNLQPVIPGWSPP